MWEINDTGIMELSFHNENIYFDSHVRWRGKGNGISGLSKYYGQRRML